MMDENTLQGKSALVTGASAGIGRETVRALADEGMNVALAARRADELDELAGAVEAEYGVETVAVPTDVTDEAAVDDLVAETVETFGGLDVVVANAGTGTERGVGIEELDTEQYRTVMDVNTDGMFFTTRAAVPHLEESAGTIVFVGSFAGKFPRSGSPVYAGTKWWTRGFALSLAAQVGPDDIGVTVINPSEVRTEFGKEYRDEAELSKQRYEPGEITEPADIAAAVVFAAQQEPPNTVTEIDLYRRDKFEMM
ncbi:putative oxidoreductase (short-chain dehydrogenase family) [Natrialba magadii ATCC 43099]|uniref:Oxidoreductase (Short-chain dehydrogenase family) n=2 Tax=Natrialba magadii (strain ATCC 43099 / DSM 3394 / CCM 3739 / CIP 104546 / IAM 13178 / JCM 8861 / NBRC 102185 / NCIMB 2190 / MS3) TaxID=547559 RepID=D3T0C6_NATMM|nr:putative oxidoreductase (short-chain dehydrogenase family) [Natrialba magadii ATCC 43099]